MQYLLMRVFHWDIEKNEKLIRERGISFEEVVLAIESGKVLDLLGHPNLHKYQNQQMFVVELKGYAYLVPFVEEKDYIFLKTIIPSRKATREYLGGSRDEPN